MFVKTMFVKTMSILNQFNPFWSNINKFDQV
jgi:hypothetical protein